MNLFSSTLSGSILEVLSEILDTLEQLRTASIEFTVMREKGLPIGLNINIHYLLAEQKQDPLIKTPPIIVDLREKKP